MSLLFSSVRIYAYTSIKYRQFNMYYEAQQQSSDTQYSFHFDCIPHRLLLGILLLLKTDSSQYKFVIAVMLFNFQGIHISAHRLIGSAGWTARAVDSEFEASLYTHKRNAASGVG